MTKELAARDANKLSLELQSIYVKCIETALQYTFKGKSMLWGREVDSSVLQRAKNTLTELDRKQQIYDGGKYEQLPYYNSNSSVVEKVKAHLTDSGTIKFVEAKDGSRSESIKRHVESKGLTAKRIRKSFSNNKQSPSKEEANNMATKKSTTKKANKSASKKATAKKATAKKVFKGKATAQDMRDAYDKNPKSFDVATYARDNDVAYGRVYGAIVKHVGGVENIGKVVKKAAAKKAAKKASK